MCLSTPEEKTATMSTEERLQKYLSQAGIASRRDAEKLITRGLVKVNGVVVKELGTKVRPGLDIVVYDGRRIELDPRRVYLLLHKPPKYISAVDDDQGRDVVTKLIPETYGRVYPVGRLDWDSEGALLMTNDGELTQLLTHPKHEVAKTYQVKVTGLIANDDPRIDKLREGVKLDDGYTTQPADIFRDADTGKHTWFVVSIREGKNRQIRRMFEAIHVDVRRLKRIGYGPVALADLPPAAYRRLTEQEIDELYKAAGQRRPTESASRGRVHVTKRKNHTKATKSAQEKTRVERPTTRPPSSGSSRDDGPPRPSSKSRQRGSGSRR